MALPRHGGRRLLPNVRCSPRFNCAAECSSAAFRPKGQGGVAYGYQLSKLDDRLQRVALSARCVQKQPKSFALTLAMPSSRTPPRPARWPSRVSGRIGFENGSESLNSDGQKAIWCAHRCQNAVHRHITCSQQSQCTPSVINNQLCEQRNRCKNRAHRCKNSSLTRHRRDKRGR